MAWEEHRRICDHDDCGRTKYWEMGYVTTPNSPSWDGEPIVLVGWSHVPMMGGDFCNVCEDREIDAEEESGKFQTVFTCIDCGVATNVPNGMREAFSAQEPEPPEVGLRAIGWTECEGSWRCNVCSNDDQRMEGE